MRQDHSDRHTFWMNASAASEWIDARARARMLAVPMQVLSLAVPTNTDRAIRFTGRPPNKADTPRLRWCLADGRQPIIHSWASWWILHHSSTKTRSTRAKRFGMAIAVHACVRSSYVPSV